MVHVVDIGVIKEGVLTEAGSIIIGHFVYVPVLSVSLFFLLTSAFITNCFICM